MKYLYYPGCSLDGTAKEYNTSTLALMKSLGCELEEISDWYCCGSSAAEFTSRLLSLSLSARVLAVAERMDVGNEILVPCSGCYLNLKNAEEQCKKDTKTFEKIKTILKEDFLDFNNTMKTRHLLDVITMDIGPEPIKKALKHSLEGFKIAPYYGCQCLRPHLVFDDPEEPHSMDSFIKATGAEIFEWNMGGKCCGASNMITKPNVALKLVKDILMKAKGADAIVTVCPMCQMNLEAYQQKVSHESGQDLNISILYLPQFLGLALGFKPSDLRLDLNLSLIDPFKSKIQPMLVA
ncbi:CoB--CoM heterodisulfide reductase iron-sulfur subunit B family protein [bacterium]|nr:CoB--CoM heterodisulfide reductase iron-sulfur subunit B family protein [bacterium]